MAEEVEEIMKRERYNEICCRLYENRVLREITVQQLVRWQENDIKKRIGRIVAEMEGNISRDELLKFFKRFIKKIYGMVQLLDETVQQISFRK